MNALILCVRTHGQPVAVPIGEAEAEVDGRYQMRTWFMDTIGIKAGDDYLVICPQSEKLRLDVVKGSEVRPAGTLHTEAMVSPN